jgi:hypothetical protein
MPRSTELPADLVPLAELNALHIRHTSYKHDDQVVTSAVVAYLRRLDERALVHRPRRRFGLYAGVLATAVLLVGASVLVFRASGTSDPPPPTATSAQSSVTAVPTTTAGASTATIGPEPGVASIQAVYDEPGGCSTTATVTGELHADPRAVGRVVWLVAVLDSPPNVLYYPKKQISAPDGRFTETIDLNTDSGDRRGHFSLIVSPTDKARDDLQRSLDADVTKNDAAYPDERRTRLQLGNVELAATPFADQRC